MEANLRKAARTAFHAFNRYALRVNFNAAMAMVVEEVAKQKRLEEERDAALLSAVRVRPLRVRITSPDAIYERGKKRTAKK